MAVALGIIGFMLAMATGSAQRVWEAFLVNLLFWMGIAQGGIAVSASFYLTNARWGGVGQYRLAEAFVGFLPLASCCSGCCLSGRHQIFVWIDHPLPEKAAWLNAPFLFARDGAGAAAHDPAESVVRAPVAARGYHSMGVHAPAISPIRRAPIRRLAVVMALCLHRDLFADRASTW